MSRRQQLSPAISPTAPRYSASPTSPPHSIVWPPEVDGDMSAAAVPLRWPSEVIHDIPTATQLRRPLEVDHDIAAAAQLRWPSEVEDHNAEAAAQLRWPSEVEDSDAEAAAQLVWPSEVEDDTSLPQDADGDSSDIPQIVWPAEFETEERRRSSLISSNVHDVHLHLKRLFKPSTPMHAQSPRQLLPFSFQHFRMMPEEAVRATLNQFAEHLKNVSPTIGKAMEIANDSTHTLDWLTWYDSNTDIIYFQPRADYDGHNMRDAYGFKHFDPDSPSTITRTIATSKVSTSDRTVGNKSLRSLSTDEGTNPGASSIPNIKYFFNQASSPGLPIIVLNSFLTICQIATSKYYSLDTDKTLSHSGLLSMFMYKIHALKQTSLHYDMGFQRYHISWARGAIHYIQVEVYDLAQDSSLIHRVAFQFDRASVPGNPRLLTVADNDRALSAGTTQREALREGGKHNRIFGEMLYAFLYNDGIQDITYDHILGIHPLYLEIFPFRALSKYTENERCRINFLNNSFQKGEAIDAGGPSSQFVTLLCKSIFRPISSLTHFTRTFCANHGIAKRIVDMTESQYPFFPDNISGSDKEFLAVNICKLFKMNLDHDRFTSRIFPDNFFLLLKNMYDTISNPPQTDSEKTISSNANLFQTINIIDPNTNGKLANFLNKYIKVESESASLNQYGKSKPRAFYTDLMEIKQILDIYLIDLEWDIESDQANQRLPPLDMVANLYHEIMNILLPLASPIEQFPSYIAGEIHRHNNWNLRRYVVDDDYRVLSARIQGLSINRADIISRIVYDGPPQDYTTVMQEKIEFLKRKIREVEDVAWIKRFLFAVTGSENVTSTTDIRILPTTYPGYTRAHTCTQTLDVYKVSHDTEPFPRDGDDAVSGLDNYNRFIKNLEFGITSTNDMNMA